MSEVERLRDKAMKCRQLALLADDVEIKRRLVALADEFVAKAVRASTQANIGRSCSGRIFSKMARERYVLDDVNVDVVTYGPGLHMLRADTSPVKDRIKQLKSVAFPSTVQFYACNVTREGMEKREGHPIDIMSDAVIVPSGVIHLMESQ